MTAIAVLLVCLAVRVTFAEHCLNPVTCPCGIKGENVTVCVPSASTHAEVCNRLLKCEECKNWFDFCTKCPEGFRGPTCSREIRKKRQKRQYDTSLRYCMDPGSVKNGRVEHDSVLNEQRRRPANGDREEYPEGSRLRYSCDEEYTPKGGTVLTCMRSGSWSPAVPPTCINADEYDRMTCDNPGRVLHGRVWYFAPGDRNGPGVKLDKEMEEYPEGSTLEYDCDKGFWIQGLYSLTCDSTGFWSATRPMCVPDCGRTFVKSEVRMHNGQPTMVGEWPWVVSISLVGEEGFDSFVCGGAVFNTRTVLTAAHCLEEDRTYVLRFGKHQYRTSDDDSLVLNRTSSRIIIHPDYNPKTLDSDIGLILFDPPIEYSNRTQPICMPTTETTLRNIVPGRVGFVSGWGETEYHLPSDSMLFAGLPVLSRRSCMESYLKQNLTPALSGNKFCAGYFNGTQSVCSGDSGSPFVFYDNLSNRYTMEGLVSGVVNRRSDAQKCGWPGRYAIFTRVVVFAHWIYENAHSLRYCMYPGSVENGRVEHVPVPNQQRRRPAIGDREEYPEGSRLRYSCDEGYTPDGPTILTCNSSGNWSPAGPPLCIYEGVDYCDSPGIFPDGHVVHYLTNGNRRVLVLLEDTEFPVGSRLEFKCDSGYRLLGNDTLTCEKFGYWSDDLPFCRIDTRVRYCMNPGKVVNGRVEHIPFLNQQRRRPANGDRKEYPEGSRLRYSCDEGYTPKGPTILTCKRSGSWSPAVPPTCRKADEYDRVTCENPGSVPNGRAWYFAPGVQSGSGVKLDNEMEEFPLFSTVEYHCDKGYWIQGSQSLMCDSMGFWSAGRPTCVPDCGRTNVRSRTARMINGRKTRAGEWPWVVYISVLEENGPRFACGGAVFNNRTVVTAAHCLKVNRTYVLRFGKYRFRNEDDDSQVVVRTSSRIIIHPDYSLRTLDSDIGLILFDPPIEYSSRVQPICMPTIETTRRNIVPGRVGYVSSWGDTEIYLPPDSLVYASLPVLSSQDCMESYKRQNLTVAITGNMFCAGYFNGTYGLCSGDSGSPFVFYDNLSKRYTMEGLVSLVPRKRTDVQPCGLPGRYTIMNKLIRFLNWIYENTQ